MAHSSVSFDELDYQIVRALHRDARVSASEIARQLNANERTIRKRIDRLIENQVLRLTAVINPEVFGYVSTADIFLEYDPERESEIVQHLLATNEITYLAFGQGSNEMSIEARFKNNEELRAFLWKVLPSVPGVKVKGYALVPLIVRNIDEWFPKKEDFGIRDEAVKP